MRVVRVLGLLLVALGTAVSVGAAATPTPGVAAVAPADSSVAAPLVLPLPVAAAPAVPFPVAAVPEPVPALVAGTPCSSAARACADLSSNQAWLIRNGKIEYGPTKIVHGMKGHRTPTGTFQVFFKSRNHVSSIYDVPMPNAVFFNGNIAFHQGPLRGGSHGCVRLSKSASQVFFNSLQHGDVVQIVR